MGDRFYTPHPLARGEFVLDGPEAHHLATVRRFTPGDRVTLFNGDGREYPAEVLSVGKKSVALTVLSVEEVNRELPFPLVVASAVPKGDRADFLIEKLTELGVTRFVPLVTERSVVQPKEAKVEKFDRMVIEASKQCGRNVLMQVSASMRWNDIVQLADLPQHRCVLHPNGIFAPGEGTGPAVVAIGPEGGFTDAEVALATAQGWRRVSLGPRILRTETAAIAAAAWFNPAAVGR
jgi:16S rRNA (uracil1498-N3)-methyltransferase